MVIIGFRSRTNHIIIHVTVCFDDTLLRAIAGIDRLQNVYLDLLIYNFDPYKSAIRILYPSKSLDNYVKIPLAKVSKLDYY